MITLNVATPSHQYPIFIGQNLLNDLTHTLKPYLSHQAAIITNTTVAPLYLAKLEAALTALGQTYFVITLPDGEAYKTWDTLNLIFDGLLNQHAERKTTLIALGGGVIGDMAGFAAATYQRGAPFIQIPTTLLSQVDSSVGGKTAINHPLGKNMIGAFYQPQAVLADMSTLSTLPKREFAAGLAEVIKYGLLGDCDFLAWLETHIDDLMAQKPAALAYAVETSCRMKAEIVAKDETEQGVRAWLNLGHTFGHAIEAELGFGTWLHGEAVATGMVLACRLSETLGTLSSADTDRVIALLQRAGLPTEPPKFAFSQWLAHMSHDKKVSQGQLRFVTLNGLGQAAIRADVSTEALQQTLAPYTA
ncbi:MAG: 3-dehydroquinate synthase [Neisseriaceae bacterium]|nr:3-dehydroquinate synthase [Neisseriaceae bacterium]